MQRLPLVAPEQSAGRTRELFATAEQMFGSVPNVARTAANSPAALEALIGLLAASGKAGIGGRLTNQVLLAVSESNACDYCTSLLTTALAPPAGLTADDILGSRRGTATDPKEAAALRFAKAVLASRGRVADAELAAVRAAGFTDQHVTEIVATVALGCFTNFLNNVADTTLDAPRAPTLAA
jgi:uncharacterized peroxidase-related enzyme